jgi:hypothetical protein
MVLEKGTCGKGSVNLERIIHFGYQCQHYVGKIRPVYLTINQLYLFRLFFPTSAIGGI